MSKRKVLVKRLVCIEDLGDVDMLFTDKTGTLTAGKIDFERAVPASPGDDADAAQQAVLRWGLLCTENSAADGSSVGGNPLDQALWQSSATQAQRPALAGYTRLATLAFDHERRMASALVRDTAGQTTVITKGAPESRPGPLPRGTRRGASGAADGVRRGQPRRRGRHPPRRRVPS